MSTFTRLGWVVASILFIVFATLSLLMIRSSTQVKQVPVFMPLLVDCGNQNPPPPPPAPGSIPPPSLGDQAPKPEDAASLELTGVESLTILHQAGRLGPTVSIEDFVRGLLLLEKDGNELALTPEQKKNLAPILKRAYERRNKLLRIQGEIQKLERELPHSAVETVGLLSPEQLRDIREKRDHISIEGFENAYWQELLAMLETK